MLLPRPPPQLPPNNSEFADLKNVGSVRLWFAKTRSPGVSVDSVTECATGSCMLTAFILVLRSIGLICRGHRAVALENVALRQQLAALTRTTRRPQLRTRDRLFWILLAKAWQEWRTAIMIVQPETWCGGTASGF